MAKNIIIGKRGTSLLQTNHISSEKFNCMALKIMQKRKENERKMLLNEIERRNCE